MKKISIHYFALLREQASKDSEIISTGLKTYGQLYNHLKTEYGFSLNIDLVQVAVNDEFSAMDCEITNEAKVVFIPPVAGG